MQKAISSPHCEGRAPVGLRNLMGTLFNWRSEMSSVSKDSLEWDFHYADIDKENLALLEQQNLREPLGGKVTLTNWCIDARYPIALLDTGWVSCSIARTDDNHSEWTYLLLVRGKQARIGLSREGSFINPERKPIEAAELAISAAFAEETGFTVAQLKAAVGIAIGAMETGRRRLYQEEREQRAREQARKAPGMIMEGEFSPLLRACIDSVDDVVNIAHIFRTLCLEHFRHQNVAVQHLSGFYLHADDSALFIFDVILWMYAYNGREVTIDGFLLDYADISNSKCHDGNDNSDKHFCLKGAISFLRENYFSQRLAEGHLVEQQGKIHFTQAYSDTIAQGLKRRS
jgi:hypothetical protein